MTEIHPSFVEQQGKGRPKTPKQPKLRADAMSAEDFCAFVSMMDVRNGWTSRKLAVALGVSETTMTTWKAKGAPRHVGLSCAAIAFGLPAWRKV